MWSPVPFIGDGIMDMEKNNDQLELKERDERPDPDQLNAVEKFYERFRGVPLRHLDVFIGCCVAALILVIVLGMLKGWGIF